MGEGRGGAHGLGGRAARAAVRGLRAEGRRVNFFRPITLRPFPGQAFQEALRASGGALLVVESAQGQLGRIIKEALAEEESGSFQTLYRPGVGITAEEIMEAVPL